VTVSTTDVWNDDAVNVREEFGGTCSDPGLTNGNLRADPLFCTGPPDWAIAASSPCAGAATDGSNLGWAATGCRSALSLEPDSWGRVKARYRSGGR
jgi:hypothetical protein